jgi:hypothetical protein
VIAKIMMLAWANDDSTLRAYESANDAYAVFQNSLLGRICGRFADNSGPRATELRGEFWFPCFELMQ